jgi:hypothetical protein
MFSTRHFRDVAATLCLEKIRNSFDLLEAKNTILCPVEKKYLPIIYIEGEISSVADFIDWEQRIPPLFPSMTTIQASLVIANTFKLT